jgi:flagellin-like protein
MRKLLKSRKALSPVVAAIILIAVTVAVSIAVAAWMGALTFTFMKTEEIAFTGQTWGSNNITITISARSDVVFSGARVDDKVTTCYRADGTAITQSAPYSVTKGSTVTIKVMNVGSAAWVAGLPYKITIVTQSSQYPWTGNAAPP